MMTQSSASSSNPLSGFKLFILLSWTFCSSCTLCFGHPPDAPDGQGTPSPSDSWHELQDRDAHNHEEPPYYADLGHYMWSWIKDLDVVPDDYEVFNTYLHHFNNIDVNGDGKLDGLELLQYMHHNDMIHRKHSDQNEIHDNHYKLTHYEKDSSFIDSLLSDSDTDRDGLFDFYEYSAAAKKFDHHKHPVMKQQRKEDHLL